ncbi:Wzz/FepE/Etk N-terminal domain-containing protein [Vibrio parahaemolyticus]|uniref:Regulator of length of O-antigen component of lipopolysaccharide chains n=2 Tax=Vibrio parahaemolyticus TaxID=670 RepID=A0A5P1PND2_VIBPH|nr:Wzz/FepE/Etk N-terminal domain-containing protein [Vibrio parahaemolyticus]EGR0033236.1 LPS O-antigen length regulator [Vibrio parahaemolyticus]EGV1829506.1 LPS O-antigen length regulator [Vibrio parahaemolyticus]EHW0647849.1 LPS O-antigen length regulator [Vibrio parahaemolyticus]EIR4182688.1 LPS O-antigen length regulator [Vibrio parahaemolyticus]EIT7124133.1 LPS O-antigen length regulator [Vibrio parahaemolyticus]
MEPQREPNPNYLPYPPNPQPTNDEIDLLELFKALWKDKWIIIATIFVFGVGSIIYALSLPNIYKADALLAPTESSNGGGLSKMAGQLGGLAALAGVNLGGSEYSQADLAIQVMKSRQFIDTFVEKHDLLVPLMAAKEWDLKRNKLVLNEEIYNSNTGEWLRPLKGLRGAVPSPQEAYEVFNKEVLSVTQDKDSGLYSISVKYYSPFLAQQWVTWLIEDINEVMRQRVITETSQNLLYLNAQLEKTAVADMQSTFYKLIEEQTKQLMLAEVQNEFIFKVIDPAVVPEIKSEPQRVKFIFFSILLGLILSIVSLSALFFFKQSKTFDRNNRNS